MNSEVSLVELESGMEELKRRLELLLGAKQQAPKDKMQQERTEAEIQKVQQKERVSLAGGQLLQAAFNFMGELLPDRPQTPQSEQLANRLKQGLAECMEQDDKGQVKLTVTLPDPSVLQTLAENLAKWLPGDTTRA